MTNTIRPNAGGTLVHTQNGLKHIEQIQFGDWVLSKPENGEGDTAFKRVVRMVDVEDCETWFVAWEDPQLLDDWAKKRIGFEEYLTLSGNNFVIITPNQPFWVVKSGEEFLKYGGSQLYIDPPWPAREWIRADRLVQGMPLQLASGRIVTLSYSTPVYNMEVEDFHTYFVDTLGVWVHNTKGNELDRDKADKAFLNIEGRKA